MASTRISERIDAGFPPDDPVTAEIGSKALDVVLAEWRDVAQALRRTVLLSVLLMVAFQLLATAKVSEVVFGPFKVRT